MRKTALITGASSGIGKEFARLFARDGHDLVLVARSEDQLRQLAAELADRFGISVKVIAIDLKDLSAPQQIHDELKQEDIRIDYLINNAGHGLYGEFIHTDVNEEISMIDVNIKALTLLTKLFLPGMVERKQGGIMNVASTAAFQPGPLMAVYFATKAYVLSFTEALENELKGTGVTVTALCPGPTETGFVQRAKLGESKLFESGVMNVQDVAKIGYQAFRRGKTLVIPGMRNRLLAFFVRFFPRKTVTRVVRHIQERKPAERT